MVFVCVHYVKSKSYENRVVTVVIELDPNMVFDRTLWRHLIHVADPT
jgi:hypothetical protein